MRQILGFELWEDRGAAATGADSLSQAAAHLARLTATFQAESRRNARECLLEGDWKASLNGLVRSLADLWPGALRTQMSEKGKLASYVQELRGQDAHFTS